MVNYFVGSDSPPAFDTLTLAINDNHPFDPRTASASVTIGINAVNDAPVNTLPGGSTTLEDTPYVFSAAGGNQISVTDVDAGGAPVQVTLNASNGVITLGGTGGLAFTSGDGTADTNMTFSGTLPAINAALNGLVFTPNLDYNGLAFIQLTTNDSVRAARRPARRYRPRDDRRPPRQRCAERDRHHRHAERGLDLHVRCSATSASTTSTSATR